MRKVLFHMLWLLVGFMLGYYAHSSMYNDICLDLGGGQQPDGFPICVIEKHSSPPSSHTITAPMSNSLSGALSGEQKMSGEQKLGDEQQQKDSVHEK